MKVKAAYLLSRPFLLDNSPYADGAFLDKPTGGFANLEAAKGFALAGLEAGSATLKLPKIPFLLIH